MVKKLSDGTVCIFVYLVALVTHYNGGVEKVLRDNFYINV